MLRVRSRLLPLCALLLATRPPALARRSSAPRSKVKSLTPASRRCQAPRVTVQNLDTNEVATAITNARGRLHAPVPAPGPLHAHRRAERLPEDAPARTCGWKSARSRPSTCSSASAPHRDGERLLRGAAARDQPSGSRHGHRQRPHRRAAAEVAQPVDARRARRRRQLQRPGHLPAPVRQRRDRRLVDQRRPEPQQRVPARRRAQQRHPGRQQHRLRAAGRSGAGIQDRHQLLRRAVRPHRRRRRQRVAEVGHQHLPRHRLRVPAPQGARRELVPARTPATRPRPTTTSISTAASSTARSSRTRRSSCSPARSTARARRRRCSARCRPTR